MQGPEGAPCRNTVKAFRRTLDNIKTLIPRVRESLGDDAAAAVTLKALTTLPVERLFSIARTFANDATKDEAGYLLFLNQVVVQFFRDQCDLPYAPAAKRARGNQPYDDPGLRASVERAYGVMARGHGL